MGRREVPPWDFRRSTVAVRELVTVARAHGVTVARSLAGSGITPAALDDPDAVIEAAQELHVTRNVIGRLGDRAPLAVEVGQRFTLASIGMLGFAILSSATVRGAFTVAVRYISLTSAFVTVSLHEARGDAAFVVDDTAIPDDVRAFFLARDLAGVSKMLPMVMGSAFATIAGDCRVELGLDERRARALAAVLPFPDVRVRQPRTAFVFPRRFFDLALPQAEPQTARLCEQQCADLVQRRRARGGFGARVRGQLLRDPGRFPPMDEIARELAVDVRTLRRYLVAERTSYRALLAEVREALAVELLAEGRLTIDELAQRLGYAETAAFTRAFTRWRGVPPSRFRR